MGEAGIPVDLSMVSPSASLQQDYAEFKQPDLNGDDKITRREVYGGEGVWERAWNRTCEKCMPGVSVDPSGPRDLKNLV